MNVAITPNLMLFGAAAGVAALSAVGVVAFNSAIRSALCLVLNFFTLAFMYFTLNAEMLGMIQVVVYTGAIMVLFLFVIMLLNLSRPKALLEKLDPKRFVGFILGGGLFALIASQVILPLQHVTAVRSDNAYGSPQALGRGLFTSYLYPFEIASILLLVGIVGSILLAKRRI